MSRIHLGDKTVTRLDVFHEDDEEYDDLINELMSVYEASEWMLFHADDGY